MQPPIKKPRRWSVVAICSALISVVLLAQTSGGHGVLRSLGLLEEPPGYSALYFSAPQSLTGQLFTDESLLTLSFGIRNAKDSSHVYAWSVSTVRAGRSTDVASGTERIAAGGEVTVVRKILTSCAGGRLEFVVHLAHTSESISYWTTCVGG